MSMDAAQLAVPASVDFRMTRRVAWFDVDSDCTFVMSQPSVDPDLWLQYLYGAEETYLKYGVESALDVPAIRDGHDTTIFWATINTAGQVVGGVRATGPLQCADDSHAVLEWAGHAGEQDVRAMINERVSLGIAEIKTAWVTDDPSQNHPLTKFIGRCTVELMSVLGIRFAMATSADYLLSRWRPSGCVVAPIPATPYPNDRYRTKLLWWDRDTFADHAEPEQVSKVFFETSEISRQLGEAGRPGTQRGQRCEHGHV
jgi:hypothetical protein